MMMHNPSDKLLKEKSKFLSEILMILVLKLVCNYRLFILHSSQTVIFHTKVNLNAFTFWWYVQYFYVLYLRLVQEIMLGIRQQIMLGIHTHIWSEQLTRFSMGLPHFQVKFHVLDLPV